MATKLKNRGGGNSNVITTERAKQYIISYLRIIVKVVERVWLLSPDTFQIIETHSTIPNGETDVVPDKINQAPTDFPSRTFSTLFTFARNRGFITSQEWNVISSVVNSGIRQRIRVDDYNSGQERWYVIVFEFLANGNLNRISIDSRNIDKQNPSIDMIDYEQIPL